MKPDEVNSSQPPVRVLILEDSLRDAKLIASTLKDKGYRVYYEVTDSPELFRESLEKAEYDLILADFNLHNWNARDAIEILKKSGKDIPLIVVTGSLGDEAAVDCIKLGAADFVLKDRPARLPAAVQRALEEKRLRVENKRAEEAAREISRRLQVLMGNLPGMAYRCRNTPEWPMEFVSEGCLALTGYTPEEMTNHRGTKYGDLIHPEDKAAVYREVQEAVRAGRPFQLEYRITTKDGRLVHVWEQGRLVAGSGLGEQWLEGFITDVTPRKQAEIELRRVNRALRTISLCDEVLVRATEEPHLLEDICGILVREGGYRMAWVGFAENDEGKSVRPVAHAGFEERYLQTADITWADTERGRGPTGTAIRTGKPVVARNTQTESHLDPWREEQLKRGYASGIALPIFLNDQVLGGLTIYAKEVDAFDSEEVRLLTELCNDLEYGIQTLRTRAERKQAEEDLRLARFSVDHASDSIIWSDIQSRIIYANEAACRNLGRFLEELLSSTIPEIDPLFPKEGWGTYWQTLRTLGTLTFETQCISKLGGVLTLEVTANYQEFNGEGYCFAFGRDITERKRAEEALRESERKYRQLHESMMDGFARGDKDGRLVEVNDAFCKIVGYTPEELSKLTYRDLTPERWHDAENDILEKQVLTRGYSEIYEKEYRRKDGAIIPVELRTYLMLDESGNPSGMWAIVRDITERTWAERMLQEYEKVVEGTDELIVVVDRDYRHLLANRAFLDKVGLEREEVICCSVSEVLGRELFERVVKQKMDECFQGKVVRYEAKRQYPKLGERDIFASYFPIEGAHGVDRLACVLQDITERKRAEEALRESERKFRRFAETITEVFWTADHLLTKMLYVSPSYERVWGRSCASLYKNPGSFLEAIHPQDRERVLANLEARKNSQPFDHEYRIVQPDGVVRWIWDRGFPARDEPGGGVWWVGVAQDITERKQAEEALIAERHLLHTVMDNLPDLIYFKDRESHFTRINLAHAKSFGLSHPSEAVGKADFDFHTAEHAQEAWRDEQEIIRTGRPLVDKEEKIVRQDGRVTWVSTTKMPLRDPNGNIIGTFGVSRDITKRMLAEEALRESEAELAAAQRIAHIGSWHWNIQTDTGYWSDETIRIFGLTPDQMKDQRKSFLEMVHPADRMSVDQAMTDALNGTGEYDVIYRFQLPDGTEKVIHSEAEVLKDQAGNPLVMRGTNHDITELKRAEGELRLAQFSLEHASDGVFWMDSQGRIISGNESACRSLGRSREELLSLSIPDIDPLVPKETWGAFWNEVKSCGSKTFETQHQTKQGGCFPVEITANYLEFDGKEYSCAFVRDITERKQAEEELYQSRQLLQSILDTIPQRVFWKDRNILYLGCNKAFAIDAGLKDPAEIIGKNDYELPWRETAECYRADDKQVMENAAPRLNFEEPQHRPDGSQWWLRSSKLPLRDQEGKVVGLIGTYEDITQRKHIEAELQRQQNFVQAVLDSVQSGIVACDERGILTLFNQATREMHGLPQEAIPAEEWAQHYGLYRADGKTPMKKEEIPLFRALQGEQLSNIEMVIIPEHGERHVVLSSGHPLINSAGRNLGAVSAMHDITDRKRAEEALRENEEKYRSVVMNIPDVVWTMDSDGHIVFVTPNIQKLSGFTAEEVYRGGFDLLIDTMHSDDVQKIQNAIKAVFRDRQPRNVEYRGRCKNGEYIWVQARAVGAFEKNGKWFVQGLLSDITERKRAEEALRQSEGKYRALVTNIPDVVWTMDSELRITFISKNIEMMSGFSIDDVNQNGFDLYISSIHPDDVHKVKDGLRALFAEGRPYDVECRMQHKSGKWMWVHDRAHSTYEKDGIRYADGLLSDITERKRTEEEILFKTALLEGQSETAIDGILIVDEEDHIVLANKQFGLNFGVPDELLSTQDDLIVRKYVTDQIEDPSAFIAKINYLNSNPKEKSSDELKFKNGRVFDRYSAPLVDSNGRHRGRIWYFRDITDRKREQKAILASEERYRTLFENAPVGIYRTTPDGRILAGNPALIRMLGYSSFEELAKCDLNNIYFDPEYPRDRFTALLEERGEVAALESSWRRPDGNILHVRENARAVRDASGKLLYYEGTVEDITERMRTEDEHVRLVTAIEQSAEAVVITNPQGTIEYVNPAFTRITGYTRAEAMGQNPRILKSGNQDKAIYRQLWETILQGKPWHGEIINRRKDGSLYTEQMSVTPVRGARGDVTHFIATKQDITARKQLELQVTQGQKMEAVGRLAGGVAHDFNNLLTIINGYAQLLMERSTPEDPRRSMFEEILTAGERAASLTRQLLAFSRRQVMEPRVLDLNHVLADTEKMLRRLIGEDVDLGTKYEAVLGRVKVDPGQIEQVIMNLAVNARDAMPEGGELLIETSNVEVDEDYARSHPNISPGKYVMVAVSDTGCGMDKETQAHVFEPFFTTKERGKGTGLGLATVYGIIKQSGGFIWVYSEPGHGSSFKIYFPSVEEAVPTADPAKARSTKLAKGTETVMVVEDEEGVRSLVCKALISKGYKVLEAEGAAVALQIAEQFKEPIHLLLTDVVMPQTGGKALAMRLIALHPETKVLYMSGYTTDAIVRQGILEEGTSFLQKPFAPNALLLKVREVLNAKPGTQH